MPPSAANKRKPDAKELESIAFAARDVAKHIERFWSVDGCELPKPTTGVAGDADAFRYGAEFLKRVERSRRSNYPGLGVEFVLRELLFEWHRLIEPFGWHLLVPPYSNYEKHSCFPVKGWRVDVVGCVKELLSAMRPIVKGTSYGVPETFTGDSVKLVIAESERLFNLIRFVPNENQRDILAELDGVAMTAEQLMTNCNIGSKETLYGKNGPGGLNELRDFGLVKNDKRIGGYYRPDAPPEASNSDNQEHQSKGLRNVRTLQNV